MNLPIALNAWAPELDLFPRELSVPLGAMARSLDTLIGPLRDRRHRGSDGEPDGYADIARRGSYERLLLSEWLLATEEPNEWMRRAVAGEHAFLALSRRKTATDRLALVLFDAGPSQWGSARLAHIAALIVLQRRARAAGARFAWGILQQPPPPADTPLWNDVTEAGILRLTKGVAAREATASDISTWRERASGDVNPRTAKPDLWLIGGPRLASLAHEANASLLNVREPIDLGNDENDAERFLIVNAHFGPDVAPRLVVADVRLPLPPPAVCVRLLRDPFGAKVHGAVPASGKAALPRDASVSELQFSLHGSKLFARAAVRGGTTLLVFPVGNSPAANVVAAPKQYRSQFGNPFFAAGRIHKATIMASLSTDSAEVRIEAVNKCEGVFPGAYRLILPNGEMTADEEMLGGSLGLDAHLMPIVPLYVPGGYQRIEELVTIMPDGRLLQLRWFPERNAGEGRITDIHCLQLYRGDEGVVLLGTLHGIAARYLLRDMANSHGERLVKYNGEQEWRALLLANPQTTGFLDGLGGRGAIVVRPGSGATFRSSLTDENIEREVPVGHRLVGIETFGSPEQLRLFLLSDDGKTVSTVSLSDLSDLTSLFHASAPITQIAKSPYAPRIAYATESGEVGVWSMEHKDYVYRRRLIDGVLANKISE